MAESCLYILSYCDWCTGVRTFCPKPVAKMIMNVGGTSSLLGLVAMASDVEGLYASVKALVCIVRSNKLAAKEMDSIKGYQVCLATDLFYFYLFFVKKNKQNDFLPVAYRYPYLYTGWSRLNDATLHFCL